MVVMSSCGGHVYLWGCGWWSCVPVGVPVDGGHVYLLGSCVPVGVWMVVMCTCGGVDGGHVYLWGC